MTMFVLEIGFHATTRRAIFTERGEAEAALAGLTPKLGLRYYGKNGDEDATYTIKTPTGDLVVVLEKVEAVRIVDVESDEALVSESIRRAEERAIDFGARYEAAIQTAKKKLKGSENG